MSRKLRDYNWQILKKRPKVNSMVILTVIEREKQKEMQNSRDSSKEILNLRD